MTMRPRFCESGSRNPALLRERLRLGPCLKHEARRALDGFESRRAPVPRSASPLCGPFRRRGHSVYLCPWNCLFEFLTVGSKASKREAQIGDARQLAVAAHRRQVAMPRVRRHLLVGCAGEVCFGDQARAQPVRRKALARVHRQLGKLGPAQQDVAHPAPVSRSSRVPSRVTLRNTDPRLIFARRNQASSARTGQVSLAALSAPRMRGSVTSAPLPAWSPLLRGRWTTTQSNSKRRWCTSMATNSERRRAPAKPTRNSARSRSPARSWAQPAIRRLTSTEVSAADGRTGLPWARPMPARVSRIAGWAPDQVRPRRRWW